MSNRQRYDLRCPKCGFAVISESRERSCAKCGIKMELENEKM